MSTGTKLTTKLKDQVWKDYTKNSKSKTELKNIFLGNNPTDAYKKISTKLKNKLTSASKSPSKSLLKYPKRKSLKPSKPSTSIIPFSAFGSPSKSPRLIRHKSSKLSPKRKTRSPKRSPRSPGRKTRSPKRSPRSLKSPSRKTRSPKRSPRSPTKKTKSSKK